MKQELFGSVGRRMVASLFLTKENKCAVYHVRPAICRLEPFTIADYDFEKNRIELELNFPYACSCEAVFNGGNCKSK